MPVKVTVDRVASIVKAIEVLGAKDVLIGIPESNAPRNTAGASNALIGYAMEFGLPAQNVPARPFLIPGVDAIRPQAEVILKKAALQALSGNLSGAERALHAAGSLGQNSVRAMIGSNIQPALAPSTIAGRYSQRGAKRMRPSEAKYMKLLGQGSTPAEAQSAAGIVSLINTGQLQRAVTYVIRTK